MTPLEEVLLKGFADIQGELSDLGRLFHEDNDHTLRVIEAIVKRVVQDMEALEADYGA